MSEAVVVALITTIGTAAVAAATAWAAVRKARLEADAQMKIVLFRLDKQDEKIGYIGNILDRLTRVETRVDGLEARK